MTTHPHAITAIRAASLRPSIGPWAALRFVQRRNCPVALYRLACQLRAVKNLGE